MMNDDDLEDHPLTNSGIMYSIDDEYEYDGDGDGDGDNEADLFGAIPTNTNNNDKSSSVSASASLFADVDQVLQEGNEEDYIKNRNESQSDADVDAVIPDDSFYRPDPENNNDIGSGSSMFYSTIYDNKTLPSQPPPLPPPPPNGPPPPPPSIGHNAFIDHNAHAYSTTQENEVNFEKVIIHDPILVHTSSLVFSGPSYWTYAITSNTNDNKKVSVRRRFRHFVALEDRVRKTCPGSILPPRPEKHPPLSDEALHQTTSFAKARALELQKYICDLLKHPLVPCTSYPSSPLHTFLTFPQDDLGVIWSEVSSSTLKRLSVSASRLTETVSTTAQGSLNYSNVIETDLQIRDLLSNEQTRLTIIQNSVPKLLGYLTLLQEFGLFCGSTGMELSKLTKDVRKLDAELSPNVEILGVALLRSSRRTKKQHGDINNALSVFENELKYISSYNAAFNDRKHACMIVDSTRTKFLEKSNRALELQNSMNPTEMHRLAQLEQDMKMMDACNADAQKKAERIGQLMTQEVSRLAKERRKKWRENLLILSKEMKQVCIDQANIWETAKKKISNV